MAGRTVGTATDEVQGFKRTDINRECWKMAAAGQLHRLKISAREVRFFTQVGLRDAMQRQLAAQELEVKAETPAWPEPRSVSPWPANMEAVVPSHVTVQVCPGYRPRCTEVELPRTYGGNQRGRVMPIGGGVFL
jgi:hypothetical protein